MNDPHPVPCPATFSRCSVSPATAKPAGAWQPTWLYLRQRVRVAELKWASVRVYASALIGSPADPLCGGFVWNRPSH